MKKLVFSRETFENDVFESEVITEDRSHYYFNDNKGFYCRIKKIHENDRYTISEV